MRKSTIARCGAALIALACAGGAVAQGQPSATGQVQHSPPPAAAPADAQAPLSPAEIRELLAAMRETAKASRENVEYSRVVPDILTQILHKLDKLEDKLDKVENAVKDQRRKR